MGFQVHCKYGCPQHSRYSLWWGSLWVARMLRWTVGLNFLLSAPPRLEPALLYPSRGSVVLLLSYILRLRGLTVQDSLPCWLRWFPLPELAGAVGGSHAPSVLGPSCSFFSVHFDFVVISSLYVAFFDSSLEACPVFDILILFPLHCSCYQILCLFFLSSVISIAFGSSWRGVLQLSEAPSVIVVL